MLIEVKITIETNFSEITNEVKQLEKFSYNHWEISYCLCLGFRRVNVSNFFASTAINNPEVKPNVMLKTGASRYDIPNFIVKDVLQTQLKAPNLHFNTVFLFLTNNLKIWALLLYQYSFIYF